MRMKNNEVINVFLNRSGKAENHTQNLYIDDYGILWNYYTPIACFYKDTLYLNATKYSVTTSKHQNNIRRCYSDCIEITESDIRKIVQDVIEEIHEARRIGNM